jgi:ATP-dependent RNA helicase DDX55/SPB4
VLVLDEADRMLDPNFKATFDKLMKKLPRQRRTGLFSATQTDNVKELVSAGMRNPVRIKVKVENMAENRLQTVPEKLESFYGVVPLPLKLQTLVWFLLHNRQKKIVLYFLTCATVDYMYALLKGLKALKYLPMFSMHGKVPAKKRPKILAEFSSTPTEGLLLVTDVAARGIDFPDVDWVVQWDAPQDPAAYTHRVGRTARNNRAGSSLILLTPEEEAYISFLDERGTPAAPVEFPAPDQLPVLFEPVRQRAVKERELYEKSQLAFVSYVRGYREHICSFIFQLSKLDLGELAQCFCMVRLPFMPEFKGRKRPSNFEPVKVKHNQIPYKDAAKESQRLEKLKREREEAASKSKPAEKLKVKKGKVVARASVHEFNERELEELNLEAKLLKKERRGKISAKQFDKKLRRELDRLDEEEQDEAFQKEKRKERRKKKRLKRGQAGDDF